jgi:ABC-type uncharacterized transport system permease subunit
MWTYKKRARFTALYMALTSVAVAIFGIYLGSWQVLLVAGLALLGTLIYGIGSERAHRGEP